MRLNNTLIFIILISAFSVFAQSGEGQKYVSPKKDGVGLYKNEVRQTYEKPIAKLSKADRLLVVQTSRYNYKVQHPDGKSGWVEKNEVVATGKSKTFVFDGADVFGYLDNPTPVYIIDADDPDAAPISLERSFKDALRENVDRETVERQVK